MIDSISIVTRPFFATCGVKWSGNETRSGELVHPAVLKAKALKLVVGVGLTI